MRPCSITFQYSYGLGTGQSCGPNSLWSTVSNTKITDLVLVDDTVIFAESLEVLVMAHDALHKEAKPLGLQVSWPKTKVQVFGGLLDETVQSEDIDILDSFTYLGSVVHNNSGSRQEILRRISLARGVMD